MDDNSDQDSVPVGTSGWRLIWRGVYLASIAAFALPFATVKSCGSDEVKEYTGFGLIPDGGAALIGVLVLAALLLYLTFVRPRATPEGRGACEAARGIAASVALVVLSWESIGLRFMFDEQRVLVGLYIALGCWLAVYVYGVFASVRQIGRLRWRASGEAFDARGIGLAVGGVGLVLAVLMTIASEGETAGEQVGAFTVSALFLLPVALLVFFAIVAARLRCTAPGSSARPS